MLLYTGENIYHTFIHYYEEEQDVQLAQQLFKEIKSIDKGYSICLTSDAPPEKRKSPDEKII